MNAQPDRPARWQHVYPQDECLLLSLAEAGGDVGDTALNAVTHLPLRIESWDSLRSLLHSQLARAETLERRRYLNRVLRWVPPLEPEDVVENDVGVPDSTGPDRYVRSYVDATWMQAAPPGCLLLSDLELSVAAASSEIRLQELLQLANALEAEGPWFDAEKESSIDELDSYTVTALFGLLLAGDVPWLGNSLVAHIARYEKFRPELRGLFRVYRRTLESYAKGTGLGSWLIDERDDEHYLCWTAWQIAWTVSRGGIASVVAGLRSELGSSDLDECTAALILIADAADYSVQSSAVLFGGGAAPERLAPNDLLLVAPPAGDAGRLTGSQIDTMVRAGLSGPRNVEHKIVRVFYGTSRARSSQEGYGVQYTSDRARELAVGFVNVAIPAKHSRGHIERPSLWRFELREDPEKHIVTLGTIEVSGAEFFDTMRAHLAANNTDATFVFVHGYNVRFEVAARRAAQLGYDLEIVPTMFSWPSGGLIHRYLADGEAAQWSVPFLVSFLLDIREQVGVRAIHLIAHSMGNRVLAGALAALQRASRAGAPIGQVVLTAPDIDAAVFEEQVAPQIVPSGAGMSLYVSSVDKALQLAHGLYRARRVGDAGQGVVIVDGIDTIDATNVSTGLGHSVFGDTRSVVEDIRLLLHQGLPPAKRNLNRVQRGQQTYWEFAR